MTYVDFRQIITEALIRNPQGLTWNELRHSLALPYTSPCPEWIARMERENCLVREKGKGRAYIWRITGT